MVVGGDASAGSPDRLLLWLASVAPLDLPEYPFPVEDTGDDDPQRSGQEILSQVFTVGLCIPHLPFKWKVVFKYFMADVDKN